MMCIHVHGVHIYIYNHICVVCIIWNMYTDNYIHTHIYIIIHVYSPAGRAQRFIMGPIL